MAVPEPLDLANDALPCRTCLTRTCCRRRVPLSLPELARIARTLGLPPSSFAELGLPVSDAPTPLRASPESLPSHILLRHADSACVFLLHLGSGRRFCGLGSLAPAACKDFPSARDLFDHRSPSCPEPWPLPVPSTPSHAEHDTLVTAWHAIFAATQDPSGLPDTVLLDALLAHTP